ncbi:hypothetical protein BCU70_00540 [Vibrio sp. 10N.286.49.C2]|nr:hypothetical protein BCU70_00540 [Vibrio sp. 10N.286.49.C2]PMH57036.1 hypothetical protein BCU66_05930 [Vibrio sp. 10N.286.49.B1]PMH83018.1 hypothetical protein BCU58_16340 [Vibrio sp. 10N.286.48.B7]
MLKLFFMLYRVNHQILLIYMTYHSFGFCFDFDVFVFVMAGLYLRVFINQFNAETYFGIKSNDVFMLQYRLYLLVCNLTFEEQLVMWR